MAFAVSSAPDRTRSARYVAAMERLVEVVQKLSQARDVNAVTAIVREAARTLTGADGATFVLREGDQCYYAEENAIAPLWKGKRFPMSACVSGWVMANGKSTTIEDVFDDPRVPADAYRPTFVKSMAMVPIRRQSPIGAIGNYWATRHRPTDEEVAILQALADTTSVALENAGLYERLTRQVQTLEEQQNRIREQHGALEIFTRALAHDLKEPIRTLRWFSQMIQQDRESPATRDTYFQYIQKAADRMAMLIDSVFNYVQLDDPCATQLEPCDMQDIMDAVQQNLAQLIQERGTLIESGNLPVVQATPAHLMQVMQNLIANAIHHNEQRVKIWISAEDQDGWWQISVKDNGSGIASDQVESVFLPFKRLTHKEGFAGLGLAICRKIVTRYGGTIGLESQLGMGATFRLTLPKAASAVNAAGPSIVAPEVNDDTSHLSSACVLLVDDRADDLEITRIMLTRRAGLECRLLRARDGREALEVLRREHVDLVLLDINMPRMDGFEFLERLRGDSSLKDLPVIMCTGSTYEKDVERAEALGAVGYMVKPPSFEEFRTLLDRVPTVKLVQHQDGYTLLGTHVGPPPHVDPQASCRHGNPSLAYLESQLLVGAGTDGH